jgi:hypothetical protein
MKRKNRTIPPLEIRELSGNCTVFFIDEVTARYVKKLWGVVDYKNAFTLDGVEFGDCSAVEQLEIIRLKNLIQDDFEKGTTMACNLIEQLEILTQAVVNLRQEAEKQTTALTLSANCCSVGSGNGGANQPGQPGNLPEEKPESTTLCKVIKYACYLSEQWFEHWLSPMATLNVTEVLGALLASLALPPYGTEIPEIAIAIIAGSVGIGIGGFLISLSDTFPALYSALYCHLNDNYPLTQSSIINWIDGEIDEVCAELGEVGIQVIKWLFRASGAIGALSDGLAGLITVPDIGDAGICECPVGNSVGWYMVYYTSWENYANGVISTKEPNVIGDGYVEFYTQSFSELILGEADNGYYYARLQRTDGLCVPIYVNAPNSDGLQKFKCNNEDAVEGNYPDCTVAMTINIVDYRSERYIETRPTIRLSEVPCV